MGSYTYMVIDAETLISYSSFDNQEEAEAEAKQMSEYHKRNFTVEEVDICEFCGGALCKCGGYCTEATGW